MIKLANLQRICHISMDVNMRFHRARRADTQRNMEREKYPSENRRHTSLRKNLIFSTEVTHQVPFPLRAAGPPGRPGRCHSDITKPPAPAMPRAPLHEPHVMAWSNWQDPSPVPPALGVTLQTTCGPLQNHGTLPIFVLFIDMTLLFLSI